LDKYVGKRLDGRYEIRDIIGVGGMAVVYKAYDCIDDRIVALKILKEEFVANEEFLRRFKNESKAIAVLSHPNIVKVYDVSFGDVMQYIVMEYIDGITLKEYIERQGSLRWKDAIHFEVQILRALQHAHDKGIVHRDVKPQNIMLLSDGTIKVTDFGIARFARSEHRTMTDKAIGSVHYISPEQARGDITDEKSDIYSAGVLLYELLTGSLPFQADSAVSVAIMQLQSSPKMPREINPAIPEGLEQITMHSMEKEPSKRYKSAAEMLRDIEEFKRDPAMVFKYTFFVDDSPTRFINRSEINSGMRADDLYSHGAAAKRIAVDIEEIEEEEEEELKKSNIVPILAGIAAAFVVVMAIGAYFVVKYITSNTESFPMPNVVGMSVNDLDQKVSDQEGNFADIEFTKKYIVDTTKSPGEIIRQSIEAGHMLKKNNAKCTIDIATDRTPTVIPTLNEFEFSAANSQLRALKFVVIKTLENHDTVPKDHVIRTSPEGGESAPEGSQIIVYVSSGPTIPTREVPDVTGFSKDIAEDKLRAAGFTEIKYAAAIDDPRNKDCIVAQNPRGGTMLATDRSITLTPSTGVETHKLEINVNLPTDYYEAQSCKIIVKKGGVTVDSATVNDYNIGLKRTYSFTVSTTKSNDDDLITVIIQGSKDNALRNAKTNGYNMFGASKFDYFVQYNVDYKNNRILSQYGGGYDNYISKSDYDEYLASISSSSSSDASSDTSPMG